MLEGHLVAIARCGFDPTLAPLRPYTALRALFAVAQRSTDWSWEYDTQFGAERHLRQYILSDVIVPGSGPRRAEIGFPGGDTVDTAEKRKSAALGYLAALEEGVTTEFGGDAPARSPQIEGLRYGIRPLLSSIAPDLIWALRALAGDRRGDRPRRAAAGLRRPWTGAPLLMETLTFLVHDPQDPISRGTVQVLEDWSAAGWLERFALVGLAEVIHHRGAVAQNRLRIPSAPGSPPAIRSLDRLADGRSVRIAVLDPVGHDQEWLTARGRRHEAGRLLHQHISGRVGALDLIIPWHNGHWDAGRMTSWPGWDTLIAAPETASSPVDTGLALYCDPDSPDDVLRVAAHAAAFVATVCGLWVGAEASMWDRSDDVDDIRMARTFHIRLDGTGASALLRAAMLDPTALHAPGAIPAKTTAEFAPRVARLRTKLQLEPAPPVSQHLAPERVGAWQAIRMLVSFLWRALLMAPSELSSTLLSRTRSASADRLSSLIFGRSSTKQVTVSGMVGRQVSAAAAVRDVSRSEERLAGVLQRLRSHDPGMPTSAPASAQEAFWRATVNNTLALISGEHSLDVDPVVEEGVYRWFTPDQIAPASALTWRPLPSLSLPGLGDEVSVHDVRACDDALGELRAMGELEGRWRDDVERSRRDLERASTEWRASFLGQVGTMLSAGIGHYRDTLTARLDELEGLSEPQQAEAEDLAGEVVRHVRVTSLIAGGGGTCPARPGCHQRRVVERLDLAARARGGLAGGAVRGLSAGPAADLPARPPCRAAGGTLHRDRA